MQLHTTANPDKGLGKERRVHAAAWQKGSHCRLKPAFLDGGAKLRSGPILATPLTLTASRYWYFLTTTGIWNGNKALGVFSYTVALLTAGAFFRAGQAPVI
jgi:hypothetical protein